MAITHGCTGDLKKKNPPQFLNRNLVLVIHCTWTVSCYRKIDNTYCYLVVQGETAFIIHEGILCTYCIIETWLQAQTI